MEIEDMMGPGFFEAVADSMLHLAIALFVAGFLFAALLFFGVPWLWALLKPFIHALTA